MLRRITQIGILALALTCSAAFAGGPAIEAPAFSQVIPLPNTLSVHAEDVPGSLLDLSSLDVVLDGTTYTMDQLKALNEPGLIIVANEAAMKSGVANAYRSLADVETLGGVPLAKNCEDATRAATFCVFYTGLNCTGTGYAVPCGNLANFPLPTRSFQNGCNAAGVTGVTFACRNVNCTDLNTAAGCPAVSIVGAGNFCFNINTYASPCGGCFRQ